MILFHIQQEYISVTTWLGCWQKHLCFCCSKDYINATFSHFCGANILVALNTKSRSLTFFWMILFDEGSLEKKLYFYMFQNISGAFHLCNIKLMLYGVFGGY